MPAELPDLGYAFGLEPKAAVEYFESKGYRISWDWTDTWQEANARAFTVAKVVRMDVLQDIRSAVGDALKGGTTFATFRKELEPTLRQKGWWGKQVVVDSKGEAEVVQLGSVRRLQTIYRTNLQTGYMAGRWHGAVANAQARPYWMYIAIDDGAVRASHLKMHRRVFRWDDPIWQSLYPPNDWGCRCRVRALTARQVEEMGLTVESSEGRLSEILELASKRTGELQPVTQFDLGAGEKFRPGVGWSYNPGAAHWQPNLDQYPYATARQYVEGVVTGLPFDRSYQKLSASVQEVAVATGLAGDALRRAVVARVGVGEFPVAVLSNEYRQALGVSSQAVYLSHDTLIKQLINRNDTLSLEDYRRIQPTLQRAVLVVRDRASHLVFYRQDDQVFRAVVKATGGGRLYVQSYRHSSARELARGESQGTVVLDKR